MVADPGVTFNADPDPDFHYNVDPDSTFHFKGDPDVMGICDHWSIDPSGLHFEPPVLHRERPRSFMALASEFLLQ
jgi:hypothetical protein